MATDGYSTFDVRLRAVRAVLRGMPLGEVARAFGTDRSTIFRWVTRHRQAGENGLYRKPGSFQDEANVSLTAVLGKTWAPRGCPLTVPVTGNRGGVSAQSAINPRGRLLFALYDKRIASAEVIHFLDQMLRHHKNRHLVVVMDQAPPHVSKKTRRYIESQKRLHVFYLPKYSPDWNPDEKVWNHLKNQELKAHRARTKAELRDLTEHRLEKMSRDPRLLQGLFFRCCVADLFE